VPVELAVREEIGERELVDRRRAAVGADLGRRQVVDPRGRRHQPAHPQPGRERLAGGAGVDHPVRVETLQRAHRRPVVAVLRVVVVFDHHRVAGAGPAQHRGPGRGRQHAAGRPLVRRGQHQRVRGHGFEGAHVDAVRTDRHADHLESGGAGVRPGVVVG